MGSSSKAWVVVEKRVVGYMHYHEVADVTDARYFRTPKALARGFAEGQEDAPCTCKQKPEPAVIYTDYADGYHWPGVVCLGCSAVIQGRDPYAEGATQTTDGLPELVNATDRDRLRPRG